jgi:hypothetical protein
MLRVGMVANRLLKSPNERNRPGRTSWSIPEGGDTTPVSIGADHPLFECNNFWVVFGEPTFGRFLSCEHFEMVDIADALACIDVDRSHFTIL